MTPMPSVEPMAGACLTAAPDSSTVTPLPSAPAARAASPSWVAGGHLGDLPLHLQGGEADLAVRRRELRLGGGVLRGGSAAREQDLAGERIGAGRSRRAGSPPRRRCARPSPGTRARRGCAPRAPAKTIRPVEPPAPGMRSDSWSMAFCAGVSGMENESLNLPPARPAVPPTTASRTSQTASTRPRRRVAKRPSRYSSTAMSGAPQQVGRAGRGQGHGGRRASSAAGSRIRKTRSREAVRPGMPPGRPSASHRSVTTRQAVRANRLSDSATTSSPSIPSRCGDPGGEDGGHLLVDHRRLGTQFRVGAHHRGEVGAAARPGPW